MKNLLSSPAEVVAKPLDLRVKKTHLHIRQAIITLLGEHEYKDITVQMILDTAMINRATFYKYYSGKSDLIAQMIDEFTVEYQQALEQRFSGGIIDFIANTAPIFYQKRHLMLALWQVNTRKHHLYQDMHELIQQVYIKKAQQRHPERPASDWEFQSKLVASLALTSIEYHFSRDKKPTPAVLDEFKQMMQILEITPAT